MRELIMQEIKLNIQTEINRDQQSPAMWCIQTFTSGPLVNVYMRHVAWDSVLLSVPGALV